MIETCAGSIMLALYHPREQVLLCQTKRTRAMLASVALCKLRGRIRFCSHHWFTISKEIGRELNEFALRLCCDFEDVGKCYRRISQSVIGGPVCSSSRHISHHCIELTHSYSDGHKMKWPLRSVIGVHRGRPSRRGVIRRIAVRPIPVYPLVMHNFSFGGRRYSADPKHEKFPIGHHSAMPTFLAKVVPKSN